MLYLDSASTPTHSDGTGRVIRHHLGADVRQHYYVYQPRSGSAGRPLFVSVHGIRRRAKAHATEFACLAERYGVVVVAPLFPKARFGDYQQLGLGGKGPRADLVLNQILTEAALLTGADSDALYLFGYSGGGQFVHRYAMLHPLKVQRIAVAAPGWYTFPDHARKFPLGTRKVPGWRQLHLDADRFLAIPTCVVVGAEDTRRSGGLNRAARIDRQQGRHRLERASRWVSAMRQAARKRHLETPFDLQILTGCAHAFRECMRHGEMGARVFDFLFGQEAKVGFSAEISGC